MNLLLFRPPKIAPPHGAGATERERGVTEKGEGTIQRDKKREHQRDRAGGEDVVKSAANGEGCPGGGCQARQEL